MGVAANILVGLVALIHVYFLVLEMFLWRTPVGRRIFGTEQAFADQAAALAANQGLYNGFLAAGLIWSIIAADPVGYQAKVFFLSCIIIAGIYGGITVTRRIVAFQALPAAIALVLVFLAH